MISSFTYSPPPAPLREARPTIAFGFLLAPAAIAMAFANPIVLAGCALAVIIAGRGAAATAALRSAAKGAVALGVLIVAVNGLVVRRGESVIFRGGEVPLLGSLDVTAEALAEGAVIAFRIAIVIAAFAIITARVDPDYLLRSVRRVAGRSALTATLLVRLVPLAVSDLDRLREARELRGPGATPVTRAAILRRLVSGTLDRAVDSAATLELRGYARSGSARVVLARRRRRFDQRFAAASGGALAAAIVAKLLGAGSFDAYPSVAIDAGPGTLALALGIPLIAALPFVPAART